MTADLIIAASIHIIDGKLDGQIKFLQTRLRHKRRRVASQLAGRPPLAVPNNDAIALTMQNGFQLPVAFHEIERLQKLEWLDRACRRRLFAEHIAVHIDAGQSHHINLAFIIARALQYLRHDVIQRVSGIFALNCADKADKMIKADCTESHQLERVDHHRIHIGRSGNIRSNRRRVARQRKRAVSQGNLAEAKNIFRRWPVQHNDLVADHERRVAGRCNKHRAGHLLPWARDCRACLVDGKRYHLHINQRHVKKRELAFACLLQHDLRPAAAAKIITACNRKRHADAQRVINPTQITAVERREFQRGIPHEHQQAVTIRHKRRITNRHARRCGPRAPHAREPKIDDRQTRTRKNANTGDATGCSGDHEMLRVDPRNLPHLRRIHRNGQNGPEGVVAAVIDRKLIGLPAAVILQTHRDKPSVRCHRPAFIPDILANKFAALGAGKLHRHIVRHVVFDNFENARDPVCLMPAENHAPRADRTALRRKRQHPSMPHRKAVLRDIRI